MGIVSAHYSKLVKWCHINSKGKLNELREDPIDMEGMGMKVITRVLFNIGCIISSIVGVLHFFAPYSFGWYPYVLG